MGTGSVAGIDAADSGCAPAVKFETSAVRPSLVWVLIPAPGG